MSPGLPARVAVVCALVAAGAPARADERRQVAVIALTADPGAKDLQNTLYTELVNHWALQPTGHRDLDAALQGEFLDEDRRFLDDATRGKVAAEDAAAQFRYAEAKTAAEGGLLYLTSVSPAKLGALAADLAFELGAAQIDLKQVNDGYRAFRLVHRLDPARRIDPAAVVPEKVAAFAQAQALRVASYKLEVKGTGRVWIDGVDTGAAPGTFEVEDGYHLVQLVGPDRVTAGRFVTVHKDDALAIDDMPASEALRLQRARLALHDAPADSVARAGPMKQLAQLLGVHDAVLIWKADDKLWVQTWRDREPGFSALREHDREPASEILAPLAPPKPPEPVRIEPPAPPRLPPVVPHVEDEPVWYQRRWVQASVAGGVIAAVVGAIVWARRAKYATYNTDTTFPPPGMKP